MLASPLAHAWSPPRDAVEPAVVREPDEVGAVDVYAVDVVGPFPPRVERDPPAVCRLPSAEMLGFEYAASSAGWRVRFRWFAPSWSMT